MISPHAQCLVARQQLKQIFDIVLGKTSFEQDWIRHAYLAL